VAVGLLLASCASGSDDTSSSATPDTTDQIATPETAETPASAPDAAAPTAAADSVGDTPDPSTTTPQATPPTTAAGPLPVPTIELTEVGQFDQPVNITSRDLDGRIFVIEQNGRVIAFDDLSVETVLDITDLTSAAGEQGLLGLAFHPNLDLAYVNFIDSEGNTVVAEYQIDPDTAVFDTDSFREVFSVIQPFPNHNGGNLEFGPDGFLYIAVGDGGAADDPNRFALDWARFIGSTRWLTATCHTRCQPTTHFSETSAKLSGRSVYAIHGASHSIP